MLYDLEGFTEDGYARIGQFDWSVETGLIVIDPMPKVLQDRFISIVTAPSVPLRVSFRQMSGPVDQRKIGTALIDIPIDDPRWIDALSDYIQGEMDILVELFEE